MNAFTRSVSRTAGVAGVCILQLLPVVCLLRADEPPTIAQFMKIRWPVSGALAPDGTFFCINNPDGVDQLYRQPPGAAEMTRLTEFPDGISGFSLSHDGRWIVVSAAVGGNEQFDLYLLEATGDQLEPLLVDSETVFGAVLWRRDARGFAYRANKEVKRDFHIYTCDLATRESKCVLAEPGNWFPADFNRAGDRLMVVKQHSATHAQLFEIALNTGQKREITPAGEAWSFEPVGYTADEKQFLVATDYRGDLTNLRSIDLATGAISPVTPEFDHLEADGALFNEDRDILAVLLNEDGYRTLHLRKWPDNTALPGPPLAKGLVGNIDFCGRDMLYSLSNANTPGIIYRWSPHDPGKSPIALTSAQTQGIDVGAFTLPRLVKYKSFDGLEVPAFLYTPAGFAPGEPIPFIVSYHGGPESQFRPGFTAHFQYFLSRGFGVLAPNVRGSSGYGKKYLELDNYQRRMDSVMDGVWAARWLVQNGYTEPGKIGALGGSYGGFMVVAAVAQAPKLFGAACNVVGIVNFRTFLERTKDYRRALREAEYGPLADSEFLESISPIRLVERIDCPMLIAHGRNDPRVPLHEAEQLHAELVRLNRPVELLVFDDEGHGFRKLDNRVAFYEKLAHFFEKHLKPAADTARTSTAEPPQ